MAVERAAVRRAGYLISADARWIQRAQNIVDCRRQTFDPLRRMRACLVDNSADSLEHLQLCDRLVAGRIAANRSHVSVLNFLL